MCVFYLVLTHLHSLDLCCQNYFEILTRRRNMDYMFRAQTTYIKVVRATLPKGLTST
jgi:hypothetical protein